MRCCEDVVAAVVDELGFRYGVAAPEEEDYAGTPRREFGDGGIGEELPAVALMRASLMGSDGEGSVEKQDPLVGPPCEVAAGERYGGAQVAVDFLYDVDERWGHRNALRHRKAKAVSLPWLVVGILSEDDYLHLVERGVVEGREDVTAFWVTGVFAALVDKELLELGKIRGVELRLQDLEPGGVDFYSH